LMAAHHNLDNLVIILDRNKKIILGDTEELLRLEPISEKWEAFGFCTVKADGHCFIELLQAFSNIGNTNSQPLLVIANTTKGKGIPLMEDQGSWHYWQKIDDKTKDEMRRHLIENETNPQ